jgi:phage terminase Nu1 subunit (DNA packaging protein)
MISKNTHKRSGPFSRNEVCALLGISEPMFDRLRRDGAPMEVGERGELKVNLQSFVKFMIADAVKKSKGSEGDGPDYDEAKARDKQAQAETRELELLKLKGLIVDVEDVRPVLREVFGTTRSRILSVPSQIIGLTAEQRRSLEDSINDALSDLSTSKFDAAAIEQPVN